MLFFSPSDVYYPGILQGFSIYIDLSGSLPGETYRAYLAGMN